MAMRSMDVPGPAGRTPGAGFHVGQCLAVVDVGVGEDRMC